MRVPFRLNFAKYRVRGHSASAKVLNRYMAACHFYSAGCLQYDMQALDPLRKLKGDDALAALLLGYEHFLWLLDPPARLGKKFGDNITYASGLDFAVQILARNPKLVFASKDLCRLAAAFLAHPRPTPCLPPRIIVGLIAKVAGKLARTGALTPEALALLRRVAGVLRKWDKEWESIPVAHLRRIQAVASCRPARSRPAART